MVFPTTMAMQIADQTVAEIRKPRSEWLCILVLVQIVLGVESHDFTQAPKHLVRIQPLAGLVLEAGMIFPIITGIVLQQDTHFIGQRPGAKCCMIQHDISFQTAHSCPMSIVPGMSLQASHVQYALI